MRGPVGAAAWGGAHPGRLPSRLRASSAASAVVWAGLAGMVASDRPAEPSARRRSRQALAALLGVSAAANLASRSRVERAIWTPVCLAGAALALADADRTTS